jgi:Cu/Ag efflux protein CusF
MRLRMMTAVTTTAMVMATSAKAIAQTRTIPGETTTITATVEAIDASTRTLTVKGPKGNLVPITVPKSMERFSEIKVGDTITARYYDNIVLRLKPPGEPAVDTASEDVTRGGASPAGTAAVQRTITATIVAIDTTVPSITFKGEKVNWTYSSRVQDKAALAKVKVGDRVDITWTEALTVSVTPPAKKD